MKNKLLIIATVFTLFLGCEKNENIIIPETLNCEDKVYVENDYLVFSSLEDYKQILDELNQYTEVQKLEWAENLNFTSAHMVYNSVETELLSAIEEGKTNFDDIIEKYKGKIKFTSDEFNYNFYIRSLEDVLNYDGIVKIGSTLYKFTEDKEYLILDGDVEKLETIEKKQLKSAISDSLVFVFDPFQTSTKKGLTPIAPTDGEPGEEGIHPEDPNRYRIKYLAESSVYSGYAGFDPYEMMWMFTRGYSFGLDLVFQKKTIFWFNNKTDISIEDVYIKYNLGGYKSSTPDDIHEEAKKKNISYFWNKETVYSTSTEGLPMPVFSINKYQATIYTDKIKKSDALVIDYQ